MSDKVVDAIAKREAARAPKAARERTKAELVAEAKAAGLATTGTKADIAERLVTPEKAE